MLNDVLKNNLRLTANRPMAVEIPSNSSEALESPAM